VISASAQCARTSWTDHFPFPGRQFQASRGTFANASRSFSDPFSYRSISCWRSAGVNLIAPPDSKTESNRGASVYRDATLSTRTVWPSGRVSTVTRAQGENGGNARSRSRDTLATSTCSRRSPAGFFGASKTQKRYSGVSGPTARPICEQPDVAIDRAAASYGPFKRGRTEKYWAARPVASTLSVPTSGRVALTHTHGSAAASSSTAIHS